MARTPKYIAIDSDILRELSFLDILHAQYGKDVKAEKLPSHSALRRDFNYFNRLLNCIIYDEIRIVIVDAVYQESKHSENLIAFMKKYCYFPNINVANYQEKAEKARQLAVAYCTDYEHQGTTMKAPMKKLFIADINKSVPSNDCYIMAQATIEGLSLLTGNGQDFIFNRRNNENPYAHDRVRGIVQINLAHGYSDENSDRQHQTSAPILLRDIAPILKHIDDLSLPTPSDDLIKGSTIL